MAECIGVETIFKPKPAIPMSIYLILCDCGKKVRLYLNARRATCKNCGKKYQYIEGRVMSSNKIIFE